MTFDCAAFEAAENLGERLKILGEGLTAFFRDFPDAEKVPLEQAGRNSPYLLRQGGLGWGIDYVDRESEMRERTLITINGQSTTLAEACGQLNLHGRRCQQSEALHIFNTLAGSPCPDASHQELTRLIGSRDKNTNAVTFRLPGFSSEDLSEQIACRMAEAHFRLATESAACLYPDPIEAKRKTNEHIGAVRKWGPRDAWVLKMKAIERSMKALYQPACVIAARNTALTAMSAKLGESIIRGDEYANRVGRLLDEAGTTLTDVFAGGATVGGAQLSPQECVTLFGSAINNLNQASRVRAASGLKIG